MDLKITYLNYGKTYKKIHKNCKDTDQLCKNLNNTIRKIVFIINISLLMSVFLNSLHKWLNNFIIE